MYQNGRNITFTDRSNSSVNMFLKDISKSQPLTNKQEYDLWFLMRQGHKQARDKFIYANLRYVVTVAKKYLASGAAFEDLIMAGSLGITIAADKFDATLGYRFISFATWYIECEVRKAAYDHLKHNSTTTSLDEPIYSDEESSGTIIDRLPSSYTSSADWHVRYDDMLNALTRGLDRQYYEGTGDMLSDYLTMLSKGYTTTDFAQKYRLSEQQMKHFLNIVSSESNRILKAA